MLLPVTEEGLVVLARRNSNRNGSISSSWGRASQEWCLYSGGCVGGSGRVFRLTWSNGGQASGQTLSERWEQVTGLLPGWAYLWQAVLRTQRLLLAQWRIRLKLISDVCHGAGGAGWPRCYFLKFLLNLSFSSKEYIYIMGRGNDLTEL